jgi:catechol 2,3-dioxygenase-like lactoylglutathione lyase family enzyme
MSSPKASALGVHSLDHFSISVPDLQVAQTFYHAFGLDVRMDEAQIRLYTFGNAHLWGLITKAPRKVVRYVSFGAFANDLPAFKSRLEERAIRLLDPPFEAVDSGFWFRDPAGLLVQIRAAERSAAAWKSPVDSVSVPEGVRGAPMRGGTASVRPRRMSHALFFTPDVTEAIGFYTDVLGLRLSDHPGPVAFLHSMHGSDHHLIAFAESCKGIGYHHSAWDVRSIHETGLGAMQMANAGFARGWGIGRHALGSNYFYYVQDPWGSYAEYSCDIDFIPAGMNWEATYPPPENSLYLWGPDVPEDFVLNYEGESNGDRP